MGLLVRIEMKTAPTLLLALLFSVTLSLTLPDTSANTNTTVDWPMFRHNLAHSGYTNSSLQANSAELLWRYPTSASVLSSPAVSDGLVFFGCKDCHIYCVNATTGELVWRFPTGHEVNSSPAVYEGCVYVGCDDGWVYCMNISTGMPVWIMWAGGYVRSSPAVVDGQVFIGSGSHDVLCYNSSDGALIWRYPTTQRVDSSPAVVDGVVYVACDDYCLYALNASTGEKIWSQYTGSNLNTPCLSNGYIYIGAYNGWVTCVEASTGTRVWTTQTGDTVASSAAAAYGRIYVGSEDGNIYCLNASDGAQLWQTKTGYWVWSSPAVANGYLFVGSQDYRLYCLDAYTGAEKWSYKAGCIIDSSPSIVDDTLYFGSHDYHLYAFRLTAAAAQQDAITEPVALSTVAFDVLFGLVLAAVLFFVIRFLYANRGVLQTIRHIPERGSIGQWFSSNTNVLAVLVIVVFAVACFLNLNGAPLWAADEKTYSQITYHMVRSGDYFIPWVNGEPAVWVGKPPILMWLMSVSYQVLGITPFSTRVWIPLFGAGALAMTYFLGKKLYNPKVGLLSMVVLGTFTTFYAFATHAMTDIPLIFFMLASIYCMLQSQEKTNHPFRYAILGGVFFGLALMTKQLEALLTPIILLLYFVFAGQARFVFSKQVGLSLGTAAAMFVPWVLYMNYLSKDFWNCYFIYNNLSRLTSPIEGHTEGYFFYFQYLLANETVWALFLPFALGLCIYMAAVKRSKADTLVLVWAAIVLVAFTLAQTKIYWYILPALPAFAIAIASLLYYTVTRIQRRNNSKEHVS